MIIDQSLTAYFDMLPHGILIWLLAFFFVGITVFVFLDFLDQ